MSKIAIGNEGEKNAREYLEKQGLNFVHQNFKCKNGEIDLVMKDDTYLIFIEVRYRQHEQFGGALESVDWKKQQRIINAAEFFIQQFTWAENYPGRFDVVCLTGNIKSPQISWIPDAFQLT